MPEFKAPRIVSLQPSITLTLAELGALESVVACTKYCADVCPEVTKRGIPIVQDSWTAKSEQIQEHRPELVIASVPYRMESLSEILKAGIPVVCLSPKSLQDVYSDIALLGSIVLKSAKAASLVAEMKTEIERVRDKSAGVLKKAAYCEEWGKPLIHSQTWVAELVEAAGGRFVGTPGAQTSAEAIREVDPDVVLAAWCGAGDRVPLEKIVADRGWSGMKAVRTGAVFCIVDELLNTPAHCLIEGLKAIAWALNPETFEKPRGIRAISGNRQ